PSSFTSSVSHPLNVPTIPSAGGGPSVASATSTLPAPSSIAATPSISLLVITQRLPWGRPLGDSVVLGCSSLVSAMGRASLSVPAETPQDLGPRPTSRQTPRSTRGENPPRRSGGLRPSSMPCASP